MRRHASVYRKEVLEAKLRAGDEVGKIDYVQPMSWGAITTIISLFFGTVLLFLFNINYPWSETVRGRLRYDKAEARIVPPAPGIIDSCNARNGELVRSGQILATVTTEQFLSDGGGLSAEEIRSLTEELSVLEGRSENAVHRARIDKDIMEKETSAASSLLENKRTEVQMQQEQLSKLTTGCRKLA